MPRRTKAAMAAGQPPSADPTEFVGRNDRGAVRPADDRYLADAELDARDAYLLEVTGPDAQQLVHKRETLRVLLDRLEDERLIVGLAGFEDRYPDLAEYRGLEALEIRNGLEQAATTMPNAMYRDLIEAVQAAVEVEGDDDDEEEVTA